MQNDIKNIACVGSGLIGQGWATLFAGAGYRVTMQDLSHDKLAHALEQVRSNLEHLADNDESPRIWPGPSGTLILSWNPCLTITMPKNRYSRRWMRWHRPTQFLPAAVPVY